MDNEQMEVDEEMNNDGRLEERKTGEKEDEREQRERRWPTQTGKRRRN